MVQKYGRDDTSNALRTQRMIGKAGLDGTVFHRPQERGALPPVPGSKRTVASTHAIFAEDVQLNGGRRESASSVAESDASGSTRSEDSAEESDSGIAGKEPVEAAVWLLNETSNTMHLGVRCSEATWGTSGRSMVASSV